MGAAPLRYYRDPQEALVTRHLDGLTLVYHRPSGMTHIVDSPLPEIMAALGAEPVEAVQLLDRLRETYDLGEEEEALAGIGLHLDSLAALGLVRIAR